MTTHLKSFWTAYLAIVAVAAPYAPVIHGAVNQFYATHGQFTAGVLAVVAVISHWLPSPAAIPTK